MVDFLKSTKNKFPYCEIFRFITIYELKFYGLSNMLS
jgi:hypothetical protein